MPEVGKPCQSSPKTRKSLPVIISSALLRETSSGGPGQWSRRAVFRPGQALQHLGQGAQGEVAQQALEPPLGPAQADVMAERLQPAGVEARLMHVEFPGVQVEGKRPA